MKKTLICSLLSLLTTVFFSSCDDYTPVDTSTHIGDILCDDNTLMSEATYNAQKQSKAVGVVFAEKATSGPILVVMLKEYNDVFCDSVGMSNGTSTSDSLYDGKTNTIAMQNSYDNDTGKGSPLASDVFSSHANGQSDYIPSVAEMWLLIKAAPSINSLIEHLGGTPIATSGDCWYWTSTEVYGNTGYQAWLCSAATGTMMETPKTEAHKARAIVQVNYPKNYN